MEHQENIVVMPKDVVATFEEGKDGAFSVELKFADGNKKGLLVFFKDIEELQGLCGYLIGLAKELKGLNDIPPKPELTALEKSALLHQMEFRVTYTRGTEIVTHLTTYQGAFDLLNGRLNYFGVKRDACAAALRAFEEKCLSGNWMLPYEAGVITIAKSD